MRKLNEGRWETLEAKSGGDSSHKEKKNWDKIEKDVVADIEKEEKEGDAAVNSLFQNIYKEADDDTKKRFADLGMTNGGSSPEELDAYIKSEIAKWSKVIKDANIQPID